jgi:hypothetical protein
MCRKKTKKRMVCFTKGNNMLISFSGEKFAGKDSAAEALISRHGFKRIGLADRLKEIMSVATSIPLEDMHNPDKKEVLFDKPLVVSKAHIETIIGILNADGFDITKDITARLYGFVGTPMVSIRNLLQFFGTDVLRNNVADDIWLNYASKLIGSANYVITDSRFANERKYLRDRGATLILVKRKGLAGGDGHISENQLGIDEDYDVIVNNDLTKTAMQSDISMWYTVKHKRE